MSRWQSVSATYYDGVCDVLCLQWRGKVMEYIQKDALVKDCRDINVDKVVEEALKPIASHPCHGGAFAAKLYEPCLKASMPCSKQFYEDAFALLLAFDSSKSDTSVGEFLASFLNLPRSCFTGAESSASRDNASVKKEADSTQCR